MQDSKNPPPATGRPAVVVIDVQTALFGATPPPWSADAVLSAINRVTAKARAAGVPVILVQHDGTAEEDLVPGTEGWQFHPALEITMQDLMLRKTTCDAFFRTKLEEELRTREVDTLVLMGYATDFCIDSTLRNALSKDFAVTIVADGHTTHDNPCLTAEQVGQHHNWAWANCATQKPVRAVTSDEIRFQGAPP